MLSVELKILFHTLKLFFLLFDVSVNDLQKISGLS